MALTQQERRPVQTAVRAPTSSRRPPGLAGQRRAGIGLTAGYAVMVVLFGVLPTIYVVYLSFVKPTGGFTLLGNFRKVAGDFRYADSFLHVAEYMACFLVPAIVLSIVLALLMQSKGRRAASTLQVIYYLPHGLIGPAGVVVWLFVLTPSVSPIGLLLRGAGFNSLQQVAGSINIALILAIIALWTGGNTLLMMYAALTSIPQELVEAANLDGANAVRLAWSVKLPMLRKWIAYVVILNIGASTQLFAEPQLLSNVSGGAFGSNWSPMQLAYTYAYQYQNFDASAAMSVQLLVIGLVVSVLVVRRFNLFRIEI